LIVRPADDARASDYSMDAPPTHLDDFFSMISSEMNLRLGIRREKDFTSPEA
jgi:hypothetical protein